MTTPVPVKKRDWPRYAVGPEGNRARFDCPGDVPATWTLEFPLISAEPEAPPKRGPGRPPKVKLE